VLQASATIIDFHLVEKCRTKFRAFVKSFGAKVRFEPVDSPLKKKQLYHGTVTVSRTCKQKFLHNCQQVRHRTCRTAACVAVELTGQGRVRAQIEQQKHMYSACRVACVWWTRRDAARTIPGQS
jgi:hypothetical protein